MNKRGCVSGIMQIGGIALIFVVLTTGFMLFMLSRDESGRALFADMLAPAITETALPPLQSEVQQYAIVDSRNVTPPATPSPAPTSTRSPTPPSASPTPSPIVSFNAEENLAIPESTPNAETAINTDDIITLAEPPVVPAAPTTLDWLTQPQRPVTRIIIPSLEIDTRVELAPIENDTWKVSHLQQEVGHLVGTGNPGEANNVVLAGHVTLEPDGADGPFKRLGYLLPGEDVIVYHGDQSYTYRLETMTTVKPDNIEVTYPTSRPVLTLITCLNFDEEAGHYSDRLVAVAVLAP